ncbi:carbohydrate ABC transporter permease [Pumilibacter intestinalis]|uniref:carbohydrate ABC transporter permease n=1 Tax=Pumilibacter intestinalis TaxID=2941511 RepID=UPI00203FD488|nr:sugar ABC transporter permease [Pumilibacter intestinalis]
MFLGALLVFIAMAAAFGTVAVADVIKAKKSKEIYRIREYGSAYLMLLPAVMLAFIFVVLPIVYSLGYAFTDFHMYYPNDINFVGWDNFVELFREISVKGELYHAIINTAIFVVCVVPLQIGLALVLALFTNRKKKGVKIFKVCFFTPVVISLTVTSFLWVQILAPNGSGMLNSFLAMFGIGPIDFLAQEDTAMLWIVLMSAWQGCGYQMLIFSSGLTNIRDDLYEAASLDGANAWKKFLHITLPGLRSTLLYITITVFVGACRVMIQPMLMTDYKLHTVTLSYYMYQLGYGSKLVGLSSAVALMMTVVIGCITLLQRKFLKED